jgi:hypothetical protein
MDRMGSPEGNGRKTGQQFKTRRQNTKTSGGKSKKSKK